MVVVLLYISWCFTVVFLFQFLTSVGGEGNVLQYSGTLAWKIPWAEEPGRLQSMGSLESDTTERLHFHSSLSCIGEGNGNPLQCSCLENPRDGGAWWATVYGVTQSRTWLKWLSSSSSSSSSPSCSCLTSYWAWMGTKTRAYQRWGK